MKRRFASETELLAEMTLDEKLNQLTMISDINEIKRRIERGELPNGASCCYLSRSVDAKLIDDVQRYMVENTRLGIPLLVMGESLHGAMLKEATVYPQCIGLGATFNDALIGDIAFHIGAEVRTAGVRQTYAPNLDLSRDPRWGRVEENYGEDPYLTARMGRAYVENLQRSGVAASPKHFIAHGSPEAGVNIAPVHIGLREFYENMFEPFYAAIHDAGAMSVMPAYSEFDGIPVHASRFLLTEVLREQMGFNGFVVSDFGAVGMLTSIHHTAASSGEAGRSAIEAGVDLEAPGVYGFGAEFRRLVECGELDIRLVDEAVLRILRIKFRLGLFDEPYVKPVAEMRSDESLRLAYRAAVESAVLLKNDGILPLGDFKRLAVIGPNANSAQLGDYTAPEAAERATTILTGLKRRFGEDKILYAKGASIASASSDMIDEAVRCAEQSDAVVVVLGDNSNFYGGIGWGDKDGGGIVTCGEGFDMAELKLPNAQIELFNSLKGLGKPIITVFVCGRPYCIGDICQASAASLYAWYPGECGGDAIAALLAGDESPSGRLPISFPKTTGHIPCFYNHKVSSRGIYHTAGRDYVFCDTNALYPFGYGLSYTEFAYSDLNVDADGASATVTVKVQNIGARKGSEAVLLFLSCHYSRITPFVRRLRGFTKLTLEPNEAARVEFKLTDIDFSFVNEDYKSEVAYGGYTVGIGGMSTDFILRKI